MPLGDSTQAGADHTTPPMEGSTEAACPCWAEVINAVVGGDTHRDAHALELVAPSGVTLATLSISNDEGGFAEALTWIAECAPGPRVVVALEGTRSYGVGLARALAAAGLTVVEIERPRRGDRRRGKSDPIDAHLAAAWAASRHRAAAHPANGRGPEALRILLGARRELTTTKTRWTNRLRALLVTGGETSAHWPAARWRQTDWPVSPAVAVLETRPVNRRCAAARRVVSRWRCARPTGNWPATSSISPTSSPTLAPALLDRRGVGPVCAAQAIVSWSHPGRCRNVAAYAALAGASPIPASSGRVVRHRLNCGGDRQLNRAMHDIVLTRWRVCPRTHAYITKRRAEGKSDHEIRRCLKRYIARVPN